jgi:GTP cyclohydrolase II
MARVSVAVSATRVSARAPAASSVARRARPVRSPRSVALRRGVGVSRRSSSSGGVPEPQPRVSPLDADAASLPEPSTNAASFDEFSVGQTDFVAETRLPTDRGFYRVRGYRHSVDGGHPTEPLAICHGDIEGREGVPVRVHDACFTSETLGSMKCDCKQQLQLAMDYIQEHDGMVIYLHQEGRGIGLANKIAAYALQDTQGLDTVDANRALGLPDDTREYTAVINILEEMGIKSIQLMTNNPRKVATMERLGVRIDGRIPCIVKANLFNQGYLEAKEGRMKHYLDGSWCYWDHSGSTFDEADEFLEGKNDAKGEAKAESRAKKKEGDEKD